MKVIDPAVDHSVDLRDIRVIQKLGCVRKQHPWEWVHTVLSTDVSFGATCVVQWEQRGTLRWGRGSPADAQGVGPSQDLGRSSPAPGPGRGAECCDAPVFLALLSCVGFVGKHNTGRIVAEFESV